MLGPRRVLIERRYQHALQKSLGYGHKFLPCGISDVTTPEKHIEIKRWSAWKHSLGQLLAYNYCDPKKQLEAHMFGEYPSDKKRLAVEIFSTYNIKVIDTERE